MKKLLLLVGMAVVLTSCVSKQVAEQTAAQRDSLERVVAAKDSLIRSVFADIRHLHSVFNHNYQPPCANNTTGAPQHSSCDKFFYELS